MDSVNKTLYIPLYGKSYVSRKGLFLEDKKAEQIWAAVGFPLKGKSRSKWLAYYMGIRAAVYDRWLTQQLEADPEAVVIHIGCGMDSRVLRVGTQGHKWYDVDFEEVIRERQLHYAQTDLYQMLPGDARDPRWLESIPETGHAIVVMEGVSMYLSLDDLRNLTAALSSHFRQLSLLVDCYTLLSAKISKYKNPINDVGVTKVYGIDDPTLLQHDGFSFVKEHTMVPQSYIDQLRGSEKFIFKKLYAGNFSKKMYRMFEYEKAPQ